MSTTTSKADGSYVIELVHPIGSVKRVVIGRFGLLHPVKWGRGEYPSVMALLAEVSGVPERTLEQMEYPDVDRVMLMFGLAVPAAIRDDIEKGRVPLISPRQVLAPEEPLNPEQEIEPDDIDPRFPKAKGPVRRMKVPDDDEGTGFSTAPKEAARKA